MLLKVSKNPEELTITDAKILFEGCRNGLFELKTYIPVSRTTPDIVIEKAKGYVELQKLPMCMPVIKAQQMLEDEQEYKDSASRSHGINEGEACEIIKKMFSPDYIVYQEKNSRIAVLVKNKGKVAIIPIDPKKEMNKDLMNGYKGSAYNIAVTLFNLDSLDSYLKNEDNVILYEKSKVNHEEATGSFVPSLSNDSPYIDNVTQPLGNVNNNDIRLRHNKKYRRLEELTEKLDKSNWCL